MMKTILLSTMLLFSATLFSQKYSKVKIYADQNGLNHLFNEGIPVDHGLRKSGVFIITDLSEYEIQRVGELNYAYEIVIDDVQKFYVEQNYSNGTPKNTNCVGENPSSGGNVPVNFQIPSTYGGYFKYNEMLAELDEMASLYPNLISVKAPISTFLTWENRPIYHVKISNNPDVDNGKPKVLYSAIHHAREPLSMSQLIYYMWYLLENYDTNPEVKYLVDNTQLFFVPCINPDGYIYNETTDPNGGGMHRKNRNPSIGTTNKGVDLNRNYAYGWNTTGVSSNQNNDTYPGTSAFSEPETQAMRWLVQHHDIKSALNAHTYGDMLLFPIGTTTSEYADHHDYFQELCNHVTQYNGYEATKSSGLYPASGDSDDYMYKSDIGVNEKDTVFAMTPEIGSSFWPASSQIIPTCQGMVFTNLGLAHMVHKYYIVAEDDADVVTSLTGNFHHTVKKLGRQNGPATVSIEPLLNINSVGSPVVYDLAIMGTDDGNISYELASGIQSGDEIKYVLTTDDGIWIQRDTIVKIYGSGTGQNDIELVNENADNTTNWSGNWNTTTAQYYSADRSFTDSPGANYQNNTSRTYQYTDNIDLTAVLTAKATFYAKWDIEANYDYCQFQVSIDGGTSWIGQCGLYTNAGNSSNGSVQPQDEPVWDGTQSTWVAEEINLSEYIGETIRVRFILESDGGVRRDGFYYDDFKVLVTEAEDEPGIGIQALTSDNLEIYPNPSGGIFYIKGATSNAKIEITDVRGLVVFRSQTDNESNSSIDVSFLSKGSYFVNISDENGNVTKQLIVR